jgi:L-ascorbate metabolism protein UlaG (beta-lactamase superfamily)
MNIATRIRYFGWSGLSIETAGGALFFDPFYRPYCGASWFGLENFTRAKYICVTHGHEEHFLDVPVIAERAGAIVIGAPSVCRFLRRRHRFGVAQLRVIDPDGGEPLALPGFTIAAFRWQHRDINLWKALSKAVFHGNATQLAWAWSSATRAPFYAPYTGFHVTLPDGLTVMNYNEGFNSKMTEAEIRALAARFRTDVLLAGMQLHFIEDVVRGVAALQPKIVILYPPHDKFHAMMGASSAPWAAFARAVRERFPAVTVHIAEPGFEWRGDGSVATFGKAA